MSLDAAELRRQKILKNSQNRLNLIMGVKNENSEATSSETKSPSIDSTPISTSTTPNEEPATHHQEPTHRHNRKGDTAERANLLAEPQIDQVQASQGSSNSSTICKFNGYSNKEIVIFFLIALSTSLLFLFQRSEYIFQNALVPFITFEFAHLVVHFRYLPSTSSQFQMFKTLLRLCGISQNSLKNLMIVFNFLFILIDNFVIYMLCFIIINTTFNLTLTYLF